MGEKESESSNEETSLRPFAPGLAFGFFNAMTWQVALGTPMVLLAEALGGTAFQVGLLYSFLFLMTPVQVVSTVLLPRFGFRNVMLFGWGGRAFCLLVPIYLAYLRPEEPQAWHVNALIGSLFVFAFLRSVGNCAFIPWMYSIIPDTIRGKYFASEQIFAGVSGVGTLLFCSLLFYWTDLYSAFIWQYGLALAGALLSWYALKRLRDGRKPENIDLGTIVRQGPRDCIRRGRYRHFLAMSVLFTMCSAPIPPFCAYYLRTVAELPAEQIIIFTILQYCGAIAGSLFLRNVIDRLGPRVFFQGAIFLYIAVAGSWWFFLQHEAAVAASLLIVYFFLGMGAASWVSANLNYLPRLTNDHNRPLRVSMHGAVTAFLGGISPIVWGLFLREGGGERGMDIAMFQAFFVFVIVSQFVLLWNVRLLKAARGEAKPIQLAGALGRPVRSLSFLINLVDSRASRREKRGKGKEER